MELVIEGLIIIGIVALIMTVIKYPKDVAKGVLGFILLPFRRIWYLFRFIMFPLEILILYIEEKLGVDYLTKFFYGKSSKAKKRKS